MMDSAADANAPVRFGILGAARVAPIALIGPARQVPGVSVSAVASRDTARAEAFARKHGIPRVHLSYRQLLDDPAIDAVYVPLPNSLHYEWGIEALRAGKHVLCEKPLAANAREAGQMGEVARETGRILAEGMHYRYHPLAARVSDIVRGGRIGSIRRIVAEVCIPLVPIGNVRYSYDLGGGAMMDLGCYAVDGVRLIAGAEPKVTGARARLFSRNVDRWMSADLEFESGTTARITCSIWSLEIPRGRVRVTGDDGELVVNGLFSAHPFHSLTLTVGRHTTRERLKDQGTTYFHQLRALAAAIRSGTPLAGDPSNAAANLQVIDAVYRHAGLPTRGRD